MKLSLYPDPALVGKAFVKQYYTQMHRDPSQLHRFYLEQSSFVHGGSDIGSENPVIGQKVDTLIVYRNVMHSDLTNVNYSSLTALIIQIPNLLCIK